LVSAIGLKDGYPLFSTVRVKTSARERLTLATQARLSCAGGARSAVDLAGTSILRGRFAADGRDCGQPALEILRSYPA
jgi:hypothetical protein